MTKHHKEKLTQRDIAAMDYGISFKAIMEAFSARKHFRNYSKTILKKLMPKARAERARIFRNCGNCANCKGYKGTANGENHYACRRGGWMPEAAAINCEHYKERGKA